MPGELPRAGDARSVRSRSDAPPGYAGPLPLPLAFGDLSPRDAGELQALKALIERQGSFRSGGYKEKCLRRRIAVRMRARGLHRYADYADLLAGDAEEYQRLLDTVTINVSKFFRNSEVWEVLRRDVVPALFALDEPEVRIWSAGAAGGEEPLSLAMLLVEHAEEHGLEGALRRFLIQATDIDRQSLEAAERGEYGEFAFGEIPAARRERWFGGPQANRVLPELRQRIRFGTLDLIGDPLPQEQHLILCRNVVIYFERAVQESLFVRFHQALVPGGILVLGKVETLFGPAAEWFEPVANRERIYRRP